MNELLKSLYINNKNNKDIESELNKLNKYDINMILEIFVTENEHIPENEYLILL